MKYLAVLGTVRYIKSLFPLYLSQMPGVEAARPPQPPQQILQSEADMSELITSDVISDNLSLDDIVSQVLFWFLQLSR